MFKYQMRVEQFRAQLISHHINDSSVQCLFWMHCYLAVMQFIAVAYINNCKNSPFAQSREIAHVRHVHFECQVHWQMPVHFLFCIASISHTQLANGKIKQKWIFVDLPANNNLPKKSARRSFRERSNSMWEYLKFKEFANISIIQTKQNITSVVLGISVCKLILFFVCFTGSSSCAGHTIDKCRFLHP